MDALSMAMKPNKTKKDAENERIEQNRGEMGALLLSKNEGSQSLSSGSIVYMNSNLFPKCEHCLLTSNVFPAGDGICGSVNVDDLYYIEFWNPDSSKSIQRLKLNKIAQPQCYQSTTGLVLIPVQPPSGSLLKPSIFYKRRTFHTAYYNKEEQCKGGDDIHCYIMGSFESKKDSLAGAPFTLIMKKDDQGQLLYELHDEGSAHVSHNYQEFKTFFSHLCPYGGALLKGKGKDTVCIGVLNFTDKGLISPVFFTQENLADVVQFFHPSCDVKQRVSTKVIANPGGRTQVDASPTGMDSTTTAKSIEKMKELLTRLLKNVAAHGYQIREVNIPSDGNCLFHAVADQLVEVLGHPGHTHESLRALAVRKLKSNEVDNHLSIDLAAVVPDNDTTKYLQKMGCNGTWGGHHELVALSDALRRTIKVVTSSDVAHSIGNFDVLAPILLGLLGELHYKSLEPKPVQDSSVHTPLASSMTATPGATRSSYEPRLLVTGRFKQSTFAHRPAIVPERNISFAGGNPTLNDDNMSSNGDDRQQLQLQDDLQNTRSLSAEDMLKRTFNILTKSREKAEEFDCKEICRLREEISQVNQDRSRLREEISQMRSHLNTIEKQFKENAEFHWQESTRLKKIILELRGHVMRVEKENEELREENKELHAENKELHAENKELRAENKELSLRAENKELSLRAENKKLSLPAENKELRAENKELREENKELREENNELRLLRAENKELREENNELREENNELREENNELRLLRRESGSSSEEEPFVDALTEPAALTLDNN